ncbi:MAG: hypothetical protein OXC45_07125 [Gemmatimonadetes bacterium]|nr:hypothetical protein [Gemmatimonadota bacterium]
MPIKRQEDIARQNTHALIQEEARDPDKGLELREEFVEELREAEAKIDAGIGLKKWSDFMKKLGIE